MAKMALRAHLNVYRGEMHNDVIREYEGYDRELGKLSADADFVRTSRDFTEEGKHNQVQQLVAKTRASLLPLLERRLKVLDDRIAQLTAEAVPTAKAKDPTQTMTQFLAEWELRQFLQKRDGMQNMELIEDAMANGDELLLGALLNSHPVLGLLRVTAVGPDGSEKTVDYRPGIVERLNDLRISKSPQAETIKAVTHDRGIHQALYEAILFDLEDAATGGLDAGPRPSSAPATQSIEEMAR